MNTNAELKEIYDSVYRNGADQFFTVSGIEEEIAILQSHDNWNGLRVLEIGCGEGKLAAMLGMAGATVDAIDYSDQALTIAKSRIRIPNVRFFHADFRELTTCYDAVVMQGVLEHLDEPWESLELVVSRLVNAGGFCVTSSPNFLNPRGYIWMALQLLLDVPMSLTDKHFLSTFDFQSWAKRTSHQIRFRTIHQDWASGERLISDYRKRLVNALRDAELPNHNVDRFLAWVRNALVHQSIHSNEGAVAIYRIGKS